ncbi:LysR family transcriptional regulator [Ponticaulis sp.]|uniref:LysR family transcriptional regulator n=1 Tax=Ponticaulis sp. TaxID=2020902 RepID=UPI000B690106|nr:LysR family transcriptional regulator [Ponticaulis sp.]MAI89867.1 LysR family transcriptional regulator [Ponticaulis sp.]OUX99541.1 MAG: LysR family transcriptional regulator [Hyphomonadaceae bacterium TMED5]|tara:strand:+ start:96075 stop:96959 length:885 start_codon:yes stop_codon:yes gene_type:complete
MSQWDGIEEFVAVAQHQSFKRAAEALNSSTSHVSRAVMRLEERLKEPLFFRTTRQVTLTDTGRSLLDHCAQLVRDRDEAFALIGGDTAPQGELRVTCATALGERFVSPIVRRFMQDNPKLTVFLDLSNRQKDLVAEGFDLAIRTGELEDSRLIRTRLTTRRWRVCASRDYVSQFGVPDTIEDLRQHDCVIGSDGLWHFAVDCAPVDFQPKGRLRCNSGASVLDAVRAGLGYCQLPDFYVREGVEQGRLIPVLDAYQAEPEPIWALYPHRRHLLPKVYMLVELLKAELPKAVNGA